MQNPTLSDLVGGIESVTLSDEEARRRGTQKTVLERRTPPTFDVLVEIQSFDRVAVHEDVGATVDALLRGFDAEAEVRRVGSDGEVIEVERVPVRRGRPRRAPRAGARARARRARPAPSVQTRSARVHAGCRRPRAARSAASCRSASAARASRTRSRARARRRSSSIQHPGRRRGDDAAPVLPPAHGPAAARPRQRGIPVYVLRNNTRAARSSSRCSRCAGAGAEDDPTTAALREAEEAIAAVSLRGERGRSSSRRRARTSAGCSTSWHSATASTPPRAGASRSAASRVVATEGARPALATCRGLERQTSARERGRPRARSSRSRAARARASPRRSPRSPRARARAGARGGDLPRARRHAARRAAARGALRPRGGRRRRWPSC